MVRRTILERLAALWRAYDPGADPHDFFTANAYLDICPPSLQDPGASEPGKRIALGARSRRPTPAGSCPGR